MIRRDLFRIGASALAWMLGKQLIKADAPPTPDNPRGVLWDRNNPEPETLGVIVPINGYLLELDSIGRVVTVRRGHKELYELTAVGSDGDDILLRLTKCEDQDQIQWTE